MTLMWREHGRRGMCAVDHEVMALGLAGDRFLDRGVQRLRRFATPQRRAQIRSVVLAEAHIERAGAGDADAVAALAEIMGQRRDEAEPAAGLGDVAHSGPGRRCGRGDRVSV